MFNMLKTVDISLATTVVTWNLLYVTGSKCLETQIFAAIFKVITTAKIGASKFHKK